MLLRTWFGAAVAAAAVAATLAVLAPPAGAASAQGCNGDATSFDGDGHTIDRAAAPGSGGTKDNPFDVTLDGRVSYRYRTDGSVAGGTAKVTIDIGFIPISFNQGISSTAKQSGRGVEPLSNHLSILDDLGLTSGLMKVDIEASGGSGATCTVSGWLKLHQSVLTTPAFYLAIIIFGLGILLAFLAMGTPT